MTILQPPLIPAGMTILQALGQGLLPANIQLTGLGNGAPNLTLLDALNAGLVAPEALASTLTFTNPATYGGN